MNEPEEAPTTANVRPLLIPPLVVTVTVRSPALAVAFIASPTVNEVGLVTCGEPTEIPVPLTLTLVPPLTKFAPVSVTVTELPAVPEDGLIEASVGAGVGTATLNVTLLLVPPLLVTVTA